MKLIKEIFQEGEMYSVGLGVFVGVPFLASFLLGKSVVSMIEELIVSIIIYTIIFVWVLRGGLDSR